MTVLDQVKQLMQAGYNDGQIAQSLQDQGISPREINNAISQSKIKEAISGPEQPQFEEGMADMQPSIINQTREEQEAQYMPQFTPQEPQIQPSEMPQEYSEEQIYPDQNITQNMQQQDYGAYYGMNTETMGDIANQIIAEKLMKTNKAIMDLSEFKIIAEAKVDKIDERLQRIESIIDQIQTSLIRKSSSQSQDVEDIKTELKGMQTSFSKVLNPLTDRIREIQNIKEKTIIKKTKKRI